MEKLEPPPVLETSPQERELTDENEGPKFFEDGQVKVITDDNI